MNKVEWKWTHNGEKNEELFECEGKYYERFAWDHFLAAYTGKVRRVGRDRPSVNTKFFGADDEGSVSINISHPWSSTPPGYNGVITIPDLFPDEPTDPMPQPVIRPGKLIASFPLHKKDKP